MNIKKLLKKALTNFDLYKLFENNINIVKYSQLPRFETIEDLFRPFNIVFILYETSDDFGHWCVICQTDTTIKFFDPYGFFPDDELKFSKKYFNHISIPLFPYLSYLLILSPKKIEYNPYELQDFDNKDISTCGRWCALFALLYRDLSIKEFAQIFHNSGIYPDTAISILTDFA